MRLGDVFLNEDDPMKFRSPDYRFTHDPRDPDSELKLLQLKHTIKQHNKENGPENQLRVMLFGRLGKNNPHANKYKERGRHGGYQYIRKDDAAHFDVYLKKRDPPFKGWNN
jgi:hypothetical protein